MPWLLVALGACAGPKGDDTAVGDTAVVDTGYSPDAPTVVSVTDALCAKQESAGDLWSFTVTETDPQGADTVDGGVVHALDGEGAELAIYEFPCDNDGICYGGFTGSQDGVGCAQGGQVVFRMVVTDKDGHDSPPFDYQTTPFG